MKYTHSMEFGEDSMEFVTLGFRYILRKSPAPHPGEPALSTQKRSETSRTCTLSKGDIRKWHGELNLFMGRIWLGELNEWGQAHGPGAFIFQDGK